MNASLGMTHGQQPGALLSPKQIKKKGPYAGNEKPALM